MFISFPHKCLIVMCLCALGLVSCVPPTPSPTSTAIPSVVITLPERSKNAYTDQELDQACTDILVFDRAKAFQNARADQPILWTFGVNFDVISPDGNPLGCFKLYERQTSSYELIWKALADVCTVKDRITFASGEAIFEGGHIECSMNLSQWVSQIAQNNKIAKNKLNNSQVGLLPSFYEEGTPPQSRSHHKYDNFTLVAKAAVSQSVSQIFSKTLKPIVLPVVSYSDASGHISPALSLEVLPKSGDSPVLTLGNCQLDKLGETYYWWYDLNKPPTHQQYAYRDINATTAVDCGSGKDHSPLKFSIEKGTLYIGYDPSTGDTFYGTMDGILVDPTDSKPTLPNGSDQEKTPTPTPKV